LSRSSRRRARRLSIAAGIAALVIIAGLAAGIFLLPKPGYTMTDQDRQIAAKASAAASAAETQRVQQAKAEYEAKTVAVPAVKGRAQRFLLVGDSLANGSAATVAAKSFRELVKSALGKRGAVESVLAGKAGQGVQLIAPQAAETGGGFDVVVVEVGTNDADRTEIPEFTAGYKAMLAQLRASSPSAAMVCLGPWRDDKMGGPYAAVIAKACAGVGGRYRPLSQHYTVATNRWTTGVMDNGKKAEDNFHPSDAGHEKIAGEILNALRLDGATS
jgi:acyl-CoA thioesterase-1